MTKPMAQLTSVQLIDAALWRELGCNEPQSADVLHQALAAAEPAGSCLNPIRPKSTLSSSFAKSKPTLIGRNVSWQCPIAASPDTKGQGWPNSRESIPARDQPSEGAGNIDFSALKAINYFAVSWTTMTLQNSFNRRLIPCPISGRSN
jgi:hypothetical protein